MTWQAGLAVAAAAVAVAGGGEDPVPLRGDTLPRNGLRLLVADDPPFVLDVDSGRGSPLRGLRELSNVSVTSVAGKAGIVRAGADVFSVRGSQVTRLGAARDVVPAGDSRSVWLKTSAGAGCELRQVRLNGRPTGARSRVSCASLVQPGGSLGVVVRRTTLVDPATAACSIERA